MSTSPVESDPAGHYAILELNSTASAADVTAAYRRLAKLLHPDMPETGDRLAFLRLQEAYQVLGDADRRADYDQPMRVDPTPRWRQEEHELAFVAPVTWWRPRFFGVILAVVTVGAVGQIGWRFFNNPGSPVPRAMAVSSAPVAGSGSTREERGREERGRDEPARPDPPALQAGDHFIAPATGPAILWQRAPEQRGYVRAGLLEAFAPVALMHQVSADGHAEIRTASGVSGFVDATRLLPGDATAARRAACLYHSGAPPRGGSLLVRPSGGPVQAVVENREDRPVVFKLRDARNVVVGAIYLSPRGQGTIGNLPVGRYRGEFAVGDLWSTMCQQFMAGMRAQRLPDMPELSGTARFIVSGSSGAADISDDEFRRE